jgi:hypothetical protein
VLRTLGKALISGSEEQAHPIYITVLYGVELWFFIIILRPKWVLRPSKIHLARPLLLT